MVTPDQDLGLNGSAVRPVPTVEAVTAEQFVHDIQAQKQPVILKRLVQDWTITSAAATSANALAGLLRQFGSQQPVPVKVKAPDTDVRYFYKDDLQACNFGLRSAPIAAIADQLLQQAEQANPMGIYMDSTPASTVLPGFENQHPMPLAPVGTPPRIWLGNTARVAPHFDVSENIACVVSGRRQFLLFPPEQVANLYVGPLENTPGGAPVSMVDPRNPDLQRYPRYEEALKHAVLATLEPGDAIYVPRFWWHYVEATGPFNLLVNYWWDTAKISPLAGLVLSARSIRRMPEADRMAMRAFFDHFVFADGAIEAFSHLPDEAQGVMGPDTPEFDQKISPALQAMIADLLKPQ